MTSFLVSYYTELSDSTTVQSIIFVRKKITALKKKVYEFAPLSPIYIHFFKTYYSDSGTSKISKLIKIFVLKIFTVIKLSF